ncbi:Cation diffusion facilitator family transporter [Aphelenchoides besseyi]|nr:Cation diffusion facilitator family transporter [Aphelenchoides besseyi]
MPSDLERRAQEEDERRCLLENGGKRTSSLDSRIQIDQRCGYFERKRKIKLLKKASAQQDRLIALYDEDTKHLDHIDTNPHDFFQQAREAKEDSLRWDQRYARIIFFINILIFGGNLASAVLSGSYSVISAFIDSMMDIFSSVVVQLTVWAINNTNKINYPRGRQRLEIISVIGVSITMAVANCMMILESVEALITNSVNPDVNLPTVIIMGTSIVVKLVLMTVCYRHGTTNAKILALDQRNDFITAVVALSAAYIGDNFFLLADPIGAILVWIETKNVTFLDVETHEIDIESRLNAPIGGFCVETTFRTTVSYLTDIKHHHIPSFVATSWFWNALDQVPLIVGKRVEQEELSRVLVIALAHDDRIKSLDHAIVYHSGERALVELHIVLDEHLSLKICHDICESLQDKINSLEFVERSFIHVDYYCDGCNDGK